MSEKRSTSSLLIDEPSPQVIPYPPFDPGHHALDEDGVFYSTLYSLDDRSQACQGLKPSSVLRRYLMYRQRGSCAECGVPEWSLSRSLHVHRLERSGLYSVHNCTLLCADCHRSEHGRGRRGAGQ